MEPQQTIRDVWRHHITGLLDRALEQNDAVIRDVAAAIATTILAGRQIYAFGAGHSLALVNEMYRRAGGMKIVRPVWNEELLSRADPEAAGKLENQAGYYSKLTDGLDWGPGDLCWVISNSGRNPLVVELAQEARRRGVTVVGLVSAEHSGTVSAAPGLPKLPEIADYLFDNAGVFGDAALDIPGLAERMAPTSTIVGSALIHATWAEVAERLLARGHVPQVWGSANRGPAQRLPVRRLPIWAVIRLRASGGGCGARAWPGRRRTCVPARPGYRAGPAEPA
jgi:uncharacterized phosphosugar-binding protein